MNVFLAIACIFLVIALAVSVTYNIRHARIILDVEDALGEAFDVCDRSYGLISRVMEMPVALATPEIRQILQEIQRVRDSVLYVSNVLAEPFGGIIEEDTDDTES